MIYALPPAVSVSTFLLQLSLFERESYKEKQKTCRFIAFFLCDLVRFDRLQEPAHTSTSCALTAVAFRTHLLSVGEDPLRANNF